MGYLTIKNLINIEQNKLGLRLICGKNGLWRNIGSIKIKYLDELDKTSSRRLSLLYLPDNSLRDLQKNKTLQESLFKKIKRNRIAGIIKNYAHSVPRGLKNFCDTNMLPLIETLLPEKDFCNKCEKILSHLQRNTTVINGVLVDVFGVGILIQGKSGMGKSEIALELITKGHRLVSDDIVEIYKDDTGELFGTSPELTAHFIEIRGLGIMDVTKIFGVSSVRDRKKLELVVELMEKKSAAIDRLGYQKWLNILGKKISKTVIPVKSGRNICTLIEVASRMYLLKKMGYDITLDIRKNLQNRLRIEGT
ncbi:MAG TPA: HPr(Ser) kinase/phosphatase [bacterium]